MRRAHLAADNYYGQAYHQSDGLEDENSELVNSLGDKVKSLKTLSIDIGTEVRTQNKMLNEMDDDFDNTTGFLKKSMNRVLALSRGGHNYFLCYLLLFALFVFFLIWLIVKFR